jgi:hypothetical protein
VTQTAPLPMISSVNVYRCATDGSVVAQRAKTVPRGRRPPLRWFTIISSGSVWGAARFEARTISRPHGLVRVGGANAPQRSATHTHALLTVLKNPVHPSSGSGWKLGRCHNGCSAASVIHNTDARVLDRNVQSRKIVHAALLLLMLEAVTTDLVSPSA